jgi:hypothetical protein
MENRSIFAQPTVSPLRQLLHEVRSGAILIPDFQRPFEWDEERRLLLLDSILKGVPIGSMLVWRTSEVDLECFRALGPFQLPAPPETRPRHYLIDGHQRLSTLYAASSTLDPSRASDGELAWPVYVDLDANDNQLAFTVLRGRPGKITLLPVPALFSPTSLWQAQQQLFKAGHVAAAERAEELANIFKDYQVPVLPLVTENIDIVTDAFVRINSGGLKMRETHMVQALAYSKFPIRARMQALRDEIASLGWGGIDEQILLNALKVRWGLDVYRSRPRQIVDQFLDEKKKTKETEEQVFERIFAELETCMKDVIPLLRSFGVWGPAALPYAYQFVALIEVRRRLGADALQTARDGLTRWFIATSFSSHFTGMTGSKIRDAVEHLADVVGGEADPIPEGLERKIGALTRHNYGGVRTKARMLFLCGQVQDPATRASRSKLLGAQGVRALQKVLPTLDGARPGAWIIADEDELVRVRALLRDVEHPERPQVLEDHVIPEAAAEALIAGDHEQFLLEREHELDARERGHLSSLGLEPSD